MKAVQELLWHATMAMTMRYSHLSPDVRKDAVDALLGNDEQRPRQHSATKPSSRKKVV